LWERIIQFMFMTKHAYFSYSKLAQNAWSALKQGWPQNSPAAGPLHQAQGTFLRHADFVGTHYTVRNLLLAGMVFLF
jgi:hypothetical protein